MLIRAQGVDRSLCSVRIKTKPRTVFGGSFDYEAGISKRDPPCSALGGRNGKTKLPDLEEALKLGGNSGSWTTEDPNGGEITHTIVGYKFRSTNKRVAVEVLTPDEYKTMGSRSYGLFETALSVVSSST